MQIHQVKRKIKNKKSYKVGRGGKHAKTSGRGTKGQNARAGRKKRPELRDFIKRFPKLRGRGKNVNTPIKEPFFVLSLEKVATVYKAGESVTPKTLVDKGLLSTYKGRLPKVKLLGAGTVAALSFSGIAVSGSARTSIEKAGGSIN